MNKRILLSLLTMSTAFAHAMEYTCYLDSFPFSLFLPARFPFNQVQHTSSLVSNLRANKNKFEKQLPFSLLQKAHGTITLLYGFDTRLIKEKPYKFLQYCYYYRHWETHEDMMRFKELKTPLLEECHKTHIDGYSALGAAIIAENASIEKKRNLIQELITYGFKPTQKDIELAELTLYDNIPEKQGETIILFLCTQENYASLLLPEIKTQIVQYMIQSFKQKFWLLPEIASNDL